MVVVCSHKVEAVWRLGSTSYRKTSSFWQDTHTMCERALSCTKPDSDVIWAILDFDAKPTHLLTAQVSGEVCANRDARWMAAFLWLRLRLLTHVSPVLTALDVHVHTPFSISCNGGRQPFFGVPVRAQLAGNLCTSPYSVHWLCHFVHLTHLFQVIGDGVKVYS